MNLKTLILNINSTEKLVFIFNFVSASMNWYKGDDSVMSITMASDKKETFEEGVMRYLRYVMASDMVKMPDEVRADTMPKFEKFVVELMAWNTAKMVEFPDHQEMTVDEFFAMVAGHGNELNAIRDRILAE